MRPLIIVLCLACSAIGQVRFDSDDPYDQNITKGIPVGEKIPEFSAVDAQGKKWDFDSIKGPKGAVLLFYRSADW